MSSNGDSPRLPSAYLMPGTSSFSDFLAEQAPDLLPSRRAVPQGLPLGTTRHTAVDRRRGGGPLGTGRGRPGAVGDHSADRAGPRLGAPTTG